MRFTNYENASDFLRDVRPYLEQREVVNGLMLGLAIRLEKEPHAYGAHRPYFGSVSDEDGRLALAALMTPPFNLILYSDRETAQLAGALELVADDLLAGSWPVRGTVGPVPLPGAFAAIWTGRAQVSAAPGMNQRVFELREVTPPRYSPGHLRAATDDDIELVIEWFEAFAAEATPDQPHLDVRQSASKRIAGQSLFIWDDNGPVSLAGNGRPTQRGIGIAPVYTPPALRGRGYASSCVAALSQRLLDSGYEYCTLFTDLANPTSNAIYQQIGYRPACDFQEIVFRENE